MGYNPFNTRQSILVNDPTSTLNTCGTLTNGQGLWSQISSGSTKTYDPFNGLEAKVEELRNQIDTQGLVIKLLRLKIHGLEGKFTQEEVANIRKMIMSEDEASRTLADTIIENA
jgi:hypothetical protein